MKFILFFIFIPWVSSELHTFITTYTGIRGQKIAGIPEFVAVTSLDGTQIDYYDNNTMKLIPKQPWIKEFASKELWTEDTEIRKDVQQIYNNNMLVLMERFNQSGGVHTYQRRYGCDYDDVTGESQGFDEYGYDGQDFISLNLKQHRYTAHVPQATLTVKKMNNDLKIIEQYFQYECIYWLREFCHLSKATFRKTDPPKVSLLQKNPDNYTCHVTGFLFRNTVISWRKNGGYINSASELVETGDTRPNEDGTFQRSVTLHVLPDELKKSQYTCVVKHQSLTETIQKILTVNEIKSNKSASDASYNSIVYSVIVIAVLIGLVVLCVHWKCWKELKARNQETYMYVKNQSLSPQPADPPISSPPEISPLQTPEIHE